MDLRERIGYNVDKIDATRKNVRQSTCNFFNSS